MVQEAAANGQPFFVGLTLVPIHGGAAIPYDAADSSYSGTVAFPNVPDGSYNIVPAAPEYHISQPQQINITGNGATTIALRLATDIYSVSGMAQNSSGEPISNAPISFSDPAGQTWNYGWHTNPDGAFLIDDLPPGTYTIHIGNPVQDQAVFTITNANFNLGVVR
jgi:hypothetical protein